MKTHFEREKAMHIDGTNYEFSFSIGLIVKTIFQRDLAKYNVREMMYSMSFLLGSTFSVTN